MKFNVIKKDGMFLKIIEAVLDAFLVNIAFYMSFYLRFNFQPEAKNLNAFYPIIPYIAAATILVFIFTNNFSTVNKTKVDIFFNSLISLFLVNIITVVIAFFARGFAFPRTIFVVGFAVQLVLIFFSKSIIVGILKRIYNKKKFMIIGSKEDTDNIARKLLLNEQNMDNLKYITNEIDSSVYPLIDEVDKIYVGTSVESKIKSDIIQYCIGKDKVVYLVPELFEIAMVNARAVEIDDIPVFEIDNLYLSVENTVIKRIFDLVFSAAVIILTLPIMAVIAILIKLDDRGPVLYKQERVTKDNKKFKVYKFRTMVINAEKRTGPVLAEEEDPRITSIGKLLRAVRLDELPQFFNVFKGDMSVVGPRPERKYFMEQFTEEIPHFKHRVVVKAGVTGLAQILGKYATSPEDKIRFDLLYIRNYSFVRDLKIIMKTIQVVFTKESANGVEEQPSLEEVFSKLNIEVNEKPFHDSIKSLD